MMFMEKDYNSQNLEHIHVRQVHNKIQMIYICRYLFGVNKLEIIDSGFRLEFNKPDDHLVQFHVFTQEQQRQLAPNRSHAMQPWQKG